MEYEMEPITVREHSSVQQFRGCLWRIFISNIIRKVNFYVSLIMSLLVILVCLFWPTTAYLVIMGEGITISQNLMIHPSPLKNFTLYSGTMISNPPKSQSIKFAKGLVKLNKNGAKYCGFEIECESEVYIKTNPLQSNDVFDYSKELVAYAVYNDINEQNKPQFLLRIPFHHTINQRYLSQDVFPFKTMIDQYIHKILNLSRIKIQFGINILPIVNKVTLNSNNVSEDKTHLKKPILKGSKNSKITTTMKPIQNTGFSNNKRSAADYMNSEDMNSSPLTKFSAGVMATHVYLGITCIILHMVANMVGDKESEMRSLSSIMGLKRVPYIFAYAVIYLVLIFLISLYSTAIVAIEPKLIQSYLRTIKTYFLVFLNYTICGCLILSQSFLISTFTRSVRIITFVVLLIQCLQLIIGMTVLKFKLENTRRTTSDYLNYFFPAIGYFNTQIELFSGSPISKVETNIYLKMSIIFLMSIAYFVIGLYLDIVIDTGTGHSFPWYFPFSYIKLLLHIELNKPQKAYSISSDTSTNNVMIEDVDSRLVRVKLEDVQKTFQSNCCCRYKEVKAVKDVTLSLQEGMITAILGHNGAGKTTTFSILVGLLKPTNGYVRIYGLDPEDPWDKGKLNQMTSICMQSDILFPNLTCIEHLYVFGVIKGLNKTEITEEINNLFQKLELMKEKHKVANVLSGGQKRKLCVAIALMGDPKIVLLDEPTSGVDPISRRCIWNVLKEYKKNRVLILSTHYMDEADILADWKAVMVKGTVVCYGTSMFLKNQFNLGYIFTCTLDSQVESTDGIIKLIKQWAPSSEFQKRYGMEMTFRIDNSDIVNLSKNASTESGLKELTDTGIIDYGISVTKLEEIFLKIGEYEKEDEISNDKIDEFLEHKMGTGKDKMASRKSHVDKTNVDILHMKQNLLNSNFVIGFYQFWTFIRLNILLSVRTPLFAVLRTFGPVFAILVAVGLYIFETRKPKVFPGTGVNTSMLDPNWPPYILYNFPETLLVNQSRWEFAADLICIRQIYGSRFVFPNETKQMEYIVGATYINVTSWNNITGYIAILGFHNQKNMGFTLLMQSLLHNCLLNRLHNTSQMVFFSIYDTWNLKWVDSGHPSFTMTSAFVYMMALSVAFTLMSPVVAGDVVRDRMTHNLQQMTLYGLKYMSYWGAHFILHLLHYTLIMCVIIIAMFTVDNYLYCEAAYAQIFVILYFLASIDTILVIYCLSFTFTDITSAEILFSFSILVPMFLMSILLFTPLYIMNALHTTFLCFFPFLNPWISIMLLDFRTRRLNHYAHNSFNTTSLLEFADILNFKPVKNSIYVHLVHIVLLSCIFVGYNTYIFVIKQKIEKQTLLELMRKPKLFQKNTSISTTIEDFVKQSNEDMIQNKDLIAEIEEKSNKFDNVTGVASDLTKIFNTVKQLCPKKVEATVALSKVNLVVNRSEIFGLLGPSGAGKTTAMHCIAHIIKPSSGKISVYDRSQGKFIPGQEAISLNLVGLCPQTNPIWPNLTIREHLLIYSALRSIPRQKRDNHSKNLIQLVHLKKYTNTKSSALSGGCKRRLSLAISLTGHPDLILLDEPSCGVDPKSRRKLWETISNAIHNTNKGALITTQFMEECEALCNRLAIIVNGRIMCIGSPQELKSKFGRGISVEIKMAPSLTKEINTQLKSDLTQFLLERYPKLLTIEHFGERITYRIPKSTNVSFGEVFEVIHEAKSLFNLEDYAVSQPTLEQVYFDFARYQTKDDLKYDVQIHWK